MNKKLLPLLSIFTFFNFSFFYSQINSSNKREGESVEYCVTHKKMEELKSNPAFLELFLQEQAIFEAAEELIRQDNSPQRVIYTIPMVFHVLHNGGVENITNAQILDALEVINRDYRKLNADTTLLANEYRSTNPNAIATAADIEIQFVLATKAPNGECFNGITRTQSSQSYSGDGQAQLNAIINGNDVYNGQWPGNKYLNIFVCGDIGGAAGYTYTPNNWMGTNMANGVYVLHDYVGRIGTSSENTSRTLTHEAGHWFNLSHLWGSTNDPGVSCGDDQVSDTPLTKGFNFCPSPNGAKVCDANIVENYQNYMDYSYCSYMFTHGQKDRVRAALNSNVGGRNNLWTTANLTAVGADGNEYLCAADFYSDRTVICPGSQIQFFDNSYNNVTSWNWSFPGAVVTNSTEQNPIVSYNSPGVYSVSLTASDGNTSLTKTVSTYITVLNSGLALPFLDGFELYSPITSSNFWEVVNQQNNAAFQITSNAGLSSPKSTLLPNFGQVGTNIDELISGPLDLSDITSSADVTLSFRFSYRKRVTTNIEKLYVLMTGNCGETWEVKKSLQGSALSSLVSATSWIPSSPSDWTTVHVTNITSTYWNENYRFKFKFESDGGNNLYLDNINIYNGGPSEELVGSPFAEVNKLDLNLSLMLYPNPADNELNISYSVLENCVTQINIVDLLGKSVQHKTIQSASGNNLVVLGTENLAPGIYNAQINIAGVTYNKQFSVK